MKALQYLNKYFLKYKYRLLLGLLITVCSKILALQVPQLIRKTVNSAEDYSNGVNTSLEAVKTELLNNILLIIGVALLCLLGVDGVFCFDRCLGLYFSYSFDFVLGFFDSAVSSLYEFPGCPQRRSGSGDDWRYPVSGHGWFGVFCW